jgi:hypothetical protein
MVDGGSSFTVVVLRHHRAVAAASVVAFNILMFVLAALGPIPMETPLVVVWIVGDALVSLVALAATENS